MATKTTFTPEEWQLLMQSVMSTGMAVTAADPNGLWGVLKEGMASAGALAKARSDPQTNELIKAIVADITTSQGRSSIQEGLRKKLEGAQPAEVKTRLVDTLRQASTLLDTKAPESALAVKNWLQGISERVAEAANEGGTMGFGGVQVSDAEKATLGEISQALKGSA